jgi:hypothetical protein
MRVSFTLHLEGTVRSHHDAMRGRFCAGLSLVAVSATLVAGVPGGSIGYPELIERLGFENVPTGAGVRVGQVEIQTVNGYGPNQVAQQEYAGKNFIAMSGPPGVSTHANTVGKNFYGLQTSIAPGVTDIHLYEVSDWLGAEFLNFTSPSTTPPDDPPAGLKIFNNSWAGDTTLLSILRRADYATTEFDLLMINGISNENSPGTNVPLLSHMYNGIAVGKTTGGHQSGDTLVDGPGRMKPEIVAPGGLTSYAVAIVSAAAALMYETGQGMTTAGGSANATRSEIIKAVLLAGAKHRPPWTNNPETSGPNRGVTSRPLDNEFGVDVVNVDRSHMILTGGEYAGSDSPPAFATASHAGWSLPAVGLNSSAYWRFSVPETANQVSIAVTWHRRVPIGFATGDVADFDLELWRVDAQNQLVSLVGDGGLPYFVSGNVVSNSSVDNVEHLFINSLAPGSYVLELRRVDKLAEHRTWDAAVAWLLPGGPCLGDIVSNVTFEPPPDGLVDGADLATLLGAWGPNPGSGADIVNNVTFNPPPDGIVDAADLAALLANWGLCN